MQGGTIVESSLLHHMDRMHGIFLPQTRGVNVGEWVAGYICGVFSAGTEVGGVTGRQITGDIAKPRETQRTLYVLALEVEGGNCTGGTRTTDKMQSLWDAYASGAADEI